MQGEGGYSSSSARVPCASPSPPGLSVPGTEQQSEWAETRWWDQAAAAVASRHSSDVRAEPAQSSGEHLGVPQDFPRGDSIPLAFASGPSPSLSPGALRGCGCLALRELAGVGGAGSCFGESKRPWLLLSANIGVRALPPPSCASSLSERLSRVPLAGACEVEADTRPRTPTQALRAPCCSRA